MNSVLTQREIGRLEVRTLVLKYHLECIKLRIDELEKAEYQLKNGNLHFKTKEAEYDTKIKLLDSILKDIDNKEF